MSREVNILFMFHFISIKMASDKVKGEVIIFTPKVDVASQNIKRQLLDNYNFRLKRKGNLTFYSNDLGILIVDCECDSIYADYVEELFEAKLFIFATRHSAASGIPALLTHTPGNWTSKATYGGKPNSVCIAPATSLKIALIELHNVIRKLDLNGWRVGLEVTHHGPYIENTPTIFIELGSTEKYWRNEIAAKALAHVIMKVAKEELSSSKFNFKIGVGFGGPHYAPRFTKLVYETDIAIGHIIPEYVFDEISRNEIISAISRTREKVDFAVIEWKGLKKRHRDFLIPILNELGVSWKRI